MAVKILNAVFRVIALYSVLFMWFDNYQIIGRKNYYIMYYI
jgi:hypothetical protein